MAYVMMIYDSHKTSGISNWVVDLLLIAGKKGEETS